MARKEKTALEKKNWTQTFNLVGEAKVNDYTFKIDEHSEKSDWIYNSLNLQIDCGEKYGRIGCELMGGYGANRDNFVYVHGKKEDGTDDFDNQYTIDWDDRLDPDVLADVGELGMYTVGLEKDTKDKTVYTKFLTPYDAIAYIHENLTDGMVVNVKGQLKYSVYNDAVQVKKEINSIVLSKAESDKYRASFTQTMLLDKDSVDKPDKQKSVFPITGYILEKFKEYNGNDLTEGGTVKGGKFVPLRKTFEYEYDASKPDLVKKAIEKVFKVKKGVTMITLEGDFVEGGAVVTATENDLTDDIKDLVELGYYTLEEALAKCAENGNRERRMILRKPVIKLVGEEGNKVPVVQKFEEKYTEDDLMLDYLIKKEVEEGIDEEELFSTDDADDEDTASDDDNSWLDNL